MKTRSHYWPSMKTTLGTFFTPFSPYSYFPLSEISILLTSCKNTIFGGRLRRGWITIVKSRICFPERKLLLFGFLGYSAGLSRFFGAIAFGVVSYPANVTEEHHFGVRLRRWWITIQYGIHTIFASQSENFRYLLVSPLVPSVLPLLWCFPLRFLSYLDISPEITLDFWLPRKSLWGTPSPDPPYW